MIALLQLYTLQNNRSLLKKGIQTVIFTFTHYVQTGLKVRIE